MLISASEVAHNDPSCSPERRGRAKRLKTRIRNASPIGRSGALAPKVRHLTVRSGNRGPLFFAGLVAFARCPDPIPSRTRPSTAFAPMVLCLKTWESRSLPGQPRTSNLGPLRLRLNAVLHSLFIRRLPPSQGQRSQAHNTRRGVEQPGSSSGS
jgi:hypothetical protein